MQNDTPIDLSTESKLNRFESNLSLVSIKDSDKLKKSIDDVRRRLEKKLPIDKKIPQLENHFCKSIDRISARLNALPEINFPENLPVSEKRKDIAELIKHNKVVILAGETGSGKTTQIPKICLSLGLGIRGLIGHTQPRRIAARTVASRIAEELGQEIGASVGYQVRFTDHTEANTHIKLMTDGILLSEIQHDPLLLKYDVIIIDEAHERSLNIDFLLGYLKRLILKRDDLKIIVTSATIDVQRFSKHFDNAPVVEVSGRTYPVTVQYHPWQDDFEDQTEAIVHCVEEIITSPAKKGVRGGDILIFMSGEREIRETSLAIKKANFKSLQVLPLYARLSLDEQTRVFNVSGSGRRVVLATNVAETSITVPGIRYVIDPGTARISRYSLRTKVQRLPIEAISQASANQRKGRCGRVSDGECFRLYSEDDFKTRPEFTDPEILRTNLAAVVLQMLHLRMGEVKHFPFVDVPDQRMINDGYKLLEELKAVDRSGRVLPIGRQLQALPVDPKFGRIILESIRNNCLNEILIIVSGMSIQDPRERPADKKQAADEKHRRFADEQSDFVAYINLWNYLEEQRQEISQNQLRKLCKKEFLNYMRVREWRDLHHQIKVSLKNIKSDVAVTINKEPASYESIHRSLTAGLLSNVALKNEEAGSREYFGTRNRKCVIFPGSSQSKKKPKWLVSAEFIETSQLFAHSVAKIDPQWVLDASEHLVKKNYFEPHYDVRSGQVKAYVKITLFGLILVEKKRVNYNKIDDEKAREVFIRSALVEGMYRGKGQFYKHNSELITEIEELEAKSRRSDILVDDEVLFNFYASSIPLNICNLAGFEYWRKQLFKGGDELGENLENTKNDKELNRTPERINESLLFLSQDELMLHGASDITETQFPSELSLDGIVLPVEYVFAPGKENDGVNLMVPVDLLHQVPEFVMQWLVPGLLREKCIALVKGLPKSVRKQMVPVPQYVDKVLSRLKACNEPLTEKLGEALSHVSGAQIAPELWNNDVLEPLYVMNLVVTDDKGKVIDSSRSLADLRDRYRKTVQKTLATVGDAHEKSGLSSWDFGRLDDTVELKKGSIKVKAYPALIDNNTEVDLKVLDNPVDAEVATHKGRCRLALLALSGSVKYLQKDLLRGKDIGLTQVELGRREKVIDDILMASVNESCFEHIETVRNQHDFEIAIENGKSSFTECARFFEAGLIECLSLVVQIRKAIKSNKNALVMTFTFGDIGNQLNHLFFPGFLFEVGKEQFSEYQRYLKAILARIEKAPLNINKDRSMLNEIHDFWSKHEARLQKESRNAYLSDKEWQVYRWMIEEFRVSLFAQTLKTRVPVSAKRLKQQWQLSSQS